MKAILSKDLSKGEVLISTNKPKYIRAFILMYIIYMKEEVLQGLLNQLVLGRSDMKIGYAVFIEAMLLKNTIDTKDNLQDHIFTSGLVPRGDRYKKLRIINEGERILPTIQNSLKLELAHKSYFVLCQLREDYI